MNDLIVLRNVALAYLTLGAVVCLVHPKIIRGHIATLKDLDLGVAGVLLKPIIALLVFLLACAVWPIAWFNVGKSEKRAEEALDAQLERLRPFHMLEAVMNLPATYAGGDGSSFEKAVIICGSTVLSGPRAEYTYIEQRYPGYQRGRQSLKEHNGRSYDVLDFTMADGVSNTIYFDITSHLQCPK